MLGCPRLLCALNPSTLQLCYTVHVAYSTQKKLSVAPHKLYIEIMSLYHPSLSISKKKSNPYLPYLYLWGMSQELDRFSYLALL